jgi:FAD:protein FMN transferase
VAPETLPAPARRGFAPGATERPRGSASWEAFGTRVVLRTTDPRGLSAARAAVERELRAIDLACSRFRADSGLSRANARAGRPVQVSPLLAQALEVALRAARITEGAVDPTVGRALELAGYDRDWRLLRAPDERTPPAPRPLRSRVRSSWLAVKFDRERRLLRVPRGIRLDLGATAKAWAADRAAEAAHAAAGCGALVSIGGDVATAGRAPADGWLVHVTDDHRSDPSAPGQTVRISSGGLATSSTAVRRWRHEGENKHHIIDPAMGAPVRSPWRTVSVAAADCTDANIASTAALVRAGQAPTWLARMGLPARLAGWNGRTLTIGAWPAQRTGASRTP